MKIRNQLSLKTSNVLSLTTWLALSVVGIGIILIVLGSVALGVLIPSQTNTDTLLRSLSECVASGSCVGGNLVLNTLIVDGNITAPNVPINNSCVTAINGVVPDNTSFNVDILPGKNILITPDQTSYSVNISTTTSLINVTMLAVQGDTLLGYQTTCIVPMLPSCLDISGQSCTGGALDNSCLPANATFDTLFVRNIQLENGTNIVGTCHFTNDTVQVLSTTTENLFLSGSFSCANATTEIPHSCLNLSGYTCPMGMPLTDSCIPANLTFYDMSVTHTLNVNLVQCGSPLSATTCLSPLAGDVIGPLDATTVATLRGVSIDSTPPNTNGIFLYNGVHWTGNEMTWSQLSLGNTIVARDASGNANVGVLNAHLIQPPLSGNTCLGLGGAAGACAKADLSLGYHSITNVNAIYVDNLYGSGTLNVVSPLITVHTNLAFANGAKLVFNNVTSLYSQSTGVLQTDSTLVVNNVLTAARFTAYNPAGVPTITVVGTGAGTGATVNITSGSNDCKLQVNVLTGTAPAANSIFTVTYQTPSTGTLTAGVVFSAASATSAALSGTSAPWLQAEALGTFTLRSGTVALSPLTLYVWNFQTCG